MQLAFSKVFSKTKSHRRINVIEYWFGNFIRCDQIREKVTVRNNDGTSLSLIIMWIASVRDIKHPLEKKCMFYRVNPAPTSRFFKFGHLRDQWSRLFSKLLPVSTSNCIYLSEKKWLHNSQTWPQLSNKI